MGDETKTETVSDAVYVVQIARMQPMGSGEDGEAVYDEEVWRDVATVSVPPRTHRKTVIEKALAASGEAPDPGVQIKVRVLDVGSALVTPVGSVQPPAQLVIGG